MNKLPFSPQYNLLFVGVDSAISHAFTKIFRLASTVSKDFISSFSIVDSSSIPDCVSYRCLKSDIGRNKAFYTAFISSCIHPNINVSFSTKDYSKNDDTSLSQFVLDRFSKSSNKSRNLNPIIVTSTSTPKVFLDSLKDIFKENKSQFKSLCHIHCDVGNPDDGGAIYMNTMNYKKLSEDFPDDFSSYELIQDIKCGDFSDPRMLSQSSMAASVLFSIITNLVNFAKIDTMPIKYSFEKMSIGKVLRENYGTPINLLDSDEGFYTIVIGTGGTGSLLLEELFQQCNNLPNAAELISIVDGDEIERKNLRNQACTVFELGEKKSIIQRNRYTSSFTDLNITSYDEYIRKLDEETILDILSPYGYVPIEYLTEGDNPIDFLDFKNFIVNKEVDVVKDLETMKFLKRLKPNDKVKVYEINDKYALIKFHLLDSLDGKNLLIVGTVDNDETRREIDKYVNSASNLKNLIYIDSGNGTDIRAGQTYLGYKQYDNWILTPIADSMLDNGKIKGNTDDIYKVGATCELEFIESPQNIATNNFAAMSLGMYISKIFLYKQIPSHYSTFNADLIYLSTFANTSVALNA